MCVLMRQGWKNENLVEEMEAPFKHIKYLIKLKNKKIKLENNRNETYMN